jgi:hypothetical protein
MAMDDPLTDATIYTGFSRLLGTPMYMSPEQAELGVIDVDTRSDVYSLGVILYELLAGVPAYDRERFRGVGFDELRRIIREVEPRRPSQAISAQSQSHRESIAQRRSIDPARLRAKLNGELEFLNNEAVDACPPSVSYRLKKYSWRNRWPLAVLCTVFSALIAISFMSTWQVWRIQKANLAIAARERQANELLEALQRRETVEDFRFGNLAAVSNRIEGWSQKPGAMRVDASKSPAGLLSLLQSAAVTPPIVTHYHDGAIHDLAVSADNQFAVSVDERG